MRYAKFGFAIAMLAALATQAMAADVRWAGSTGDFDWQTFGNWETTGDVARGAPVDGENILFQPAHGNNATIDINGATTNLPATIVYPQDNNPVNLWIYDSATLSPISSPPANNTSFTINGGHASIEAAAAAAQMITVKDIIYEKKGNIRWYTPLTVTGNHKGPEDGSAWYYGPVVFNNDIIPRNSGWKTTMNFYGDYTANTKDTGYRTDGGNLNYFFGKSTIGVINQKSGELHFNDLRLTGEFHQANHSIATIAGRYSGNGTYVKDPNEAGEIRTPSITLLAGSTLAPGDSIGALGSLALTLNAVDGGTYEWEVGASPRSSTPGVGWDLAVADTINLGGDILFQIVETGLTEDILPSDVFLVLQANNLDIAGVQGINFEVLTDQATWDITNAVLAPAPQGGGLVLTGISARLGGGQTGDDIPEPATMALCGLMLAGLGGYVRKRRRA